MQVGTSLYDNYAALLRYRQDVTQNKHKEAEILPIEKPQIQPIKHPSETIDKEALQSKIDEKKDNLRQFVALSAGINSVKSQFEIYMEGMTGDEYSSDTIVKLEDLREIQRQNNIVKAYAYYQENGLSA